MANVRTASESRDVDDHSIIRRCGAIHEPLYIGKAPEQPLQWRVLAGVRARDVGEFAFEGGGEREAADELHLGRRCGERRIARLPRAVDDEAGGRSIQKKPPRSKR